jgi:chaperone required for assembly of F1-ATPase
VSEGVKRFWSEASVAPTEVGHEVHLDGKPMRLPGGPVLSVPGRRLAEAIAAEWRQAGGGNGGEMSFADTPLTRLAGTAQQRIVPDPWPTVDGIAGYGENDLLCYRADFPPELVARQESGWQPWLDWAEQRYGAPLRVASGVMHVKQHRSSVAALREAVVRLDPYELAGLGIAVPALGSLVLGLALAEGGLDPATAHALGALDELFQAELWGEDAEATARRAAVADDIALAARFIRLVRGQE